MRRSRFRIAVGAFLAVVAVAAVGLATASAAPASQDAARFTLYAANQENQQVDTDQDGQNSPGDISLFRAHLYTNPARTHSFGWITAVCTNTFGTDQMCQASIRRSGNGQLTLQGLIHQGDSFAIAITGGTGGYRNADGVVRVLGADSQGKNLRFKVRLDLD